MGTDPRYRRGTPSSHSRTAQYNRTAVVTVTSHRHRAFESLQLRSQTVVQFLFSSSTVSDLIQRIDHLELKITPSPAAFSKARLPEESRVSHADR